MSLGIAVYIVPFSHQLLRSILLGHDAFMGFELGPLNHPFCFIALFAIHYVYQVKLLLSDLSPSVPCEVVIPGEIVEKVTS